MQVGIPISVLFSGVFFPLGVLLYWFTSNIWTMLQQFYIFRYHPHTPGVPAAVTTGAATAKALAPKVGQKPVRPKGNRPAGSNGVANPVDPAGPDDAAASPNGAAPGPNEATSTSNGEAPPVRDQPSAPPTPRPANRTPRPSGGRAPAKRAPSKKRR
jgi:YidC/Oxa1 family membrane protein insertase